VKLLLSRLSSVPFAIAIVALGLVSLRDTEVISNFPASSIFPFAE
jgi:hypothetical protein